MSALLSNTVCENICFVFLKSTGRSFDREIFEMKVIRIVNQMLLWAAGCLMALNAAGSVNAKPSAEIMVSAAISLKTAFEEIAKLFES